MSSQIVDQVQKLTKATTDKLATVEKANADLQKKVDEQSLIIKRIQETPVYQGPTPGKIFASPRDMGEEGKWGFKNVGEFAKEVISSRQKGSVSERLVKTYSHEYVTKAATGMGEMVGSDGGFLVPPTFAANIFERAYSNDDLMKRTDGYTTTGNSMTFPRNAETSRANGSRWGGVLAYWLQEGSAGTNTKPTFGRLTLNLHKLMCLAALTSELVEDSGTALTQYVNRVFAEEIKFQSGNSVVRGSGAGQPLGFLNCPCAVEVSKETGQAAATINTQNIVKMWSRMFGPCRSNAIWLINQDVEPQLYTMTLGIGTAGIATYMPPGGLSDKPYATLIGRPVVPVEWCSTLGTVGDIILVDPSQYVTLTKGGVNAESSMHFYFNTDEQALRVVYRLDGQPWWASALTPFQGSNTQSCIVTLATRS